MTLYHPNTDTEIARLHAQGHAPEHIADELAIPVTHVNRIAPNPSTRQHILDLWHAGIGKREISATLLLPLATIQTVIAAGSTHYRRPPRTPDSSTGTRPLGRIEHLLAEAEASPRQRTRTLATRTRTLLDQIRAELKNEDEERRMQARIAKAEADLAKAREALRQAQKRT